MTVFSRKMPHQQAQPQDVIDDKKEEAVAAKDSKEEKA